MRPGAADHRDHQRRAGEPLALEFELVGGGVGMVGGKGRGNRRAGGEAGFAFEHDEAPRRELAVVWHARRDGKQGVDFRKRRPWAGQFHRLHRTAGLQELQGIGHGHLVRRMISKSGYRFPDKFMRNQKAVCA